MLPTSGAKLRSYRNAIGLSQFRLAKLLGISSATLSSLERTDAELDSDLYEKIDVIFKNWKKPNKKSPRKTNSDSSRTNLPPSPGISTNCCALTKVSSTNQSAREETSFNAIAFFAGCGGLSKGFHDAGIRIDGFVELDSAARSTFKRNFPNAKCLAHSVEEMEVTNKNRLNPDFLIGGPPCQGFSLAGKRDPRDPRNTLFQYLVKAAEFWKPKIIIMENVRLLLSMKDEDGRLVIDNIKKEFSRIGYNTQVWELNAQDYGVPQSRERIFVVGTDKELPLPIQPKPTHFAPGNPSLFPQEKFVTFAEATKDLETLESGQRSDADSLHWSVSHPNRVISWLKNVPQGKSAHDNEDPSKRPPSGYNTTYKRLVMDEPSSTIGTTFGMISGSRNVHPINTRSLTIREAARLQSFPDNYIFEGNWGEIRTQIGNAVPPQLAKVVAQAILKIME